jgi:6-phosphogluconolactonase (cycloisomerase 2 family)
MKYFSNSAIAVSRLIACCLLAFSLQSCGGGGGGSGDTAGVPTPITPAPAPANSALYLPYYGKNTLQGFRLLENNYKLQKVAPLPTGVNPIAIAGTSLNQPVGCAFTANEGSNSVSIFKADSASGLNAASPAAIAAGTAPSDVALKGTITLVANFGDNTVSRYALDPSNCNLRFLGASAVGDRPSTVAMVGSYALVTTYDRKIQVYDVDPVSGALAAKGAALATGVAPFAVNYWDGADGRAVVIPFVVANQDSDTVSVYSFNASTGALSKVGADLPAGNGPGFVWPLILPNGKVMFYVANTLGNSISSYELNPTTRALTPAGTTVATLSQPFYLAPSYLASTINKYLYAFHDGTDDVSAFEIDQATGALKALGSAL